MKQTEWCVIANPKAGSLDDAGALEKELDRLGSYQMVETANPGDGERAAREAVRGRDPQNRVCRWRRHAQ